MMLFILNTKTLIDNKTVNELLSNLFGLVVDQIDILGGDRNNPKITYEIKQRPCFTEFNFEIVFFVPELECLKAEIYNDLAVALNLSKLISDEVVIHDQSNDPYRWILINSKEEIYLVDELISDDINNQSFAIDRKSLKKISNEVALSALPDKNYVLLEQENRPVFYNQLKNWP